MDSRARQLACRLGGRRGLILLIFWITALAGPPLWAHGGGLNREGCHHNRKTGDYHCHQPKPGATPWPPRRDLPVEEEPANEGRKREDGSSRSQRVPIPKGYSAFELTATAQTLLSILGDYHGQSHGVLDDPTRQAILRFQKRHQLAATGQSSGALLKRLASEVAGRCRRSR
ncbi:MAG: YHYH domain-containing protein [Acidobacteriota bacterium]|nr:YHYH domain-containing protein [Acidobacteriota bacterium]